MYDIKSNIATDFIDHNEILESIAEAREKAADREYVESLIERSKDCKGLSHREAATLLECDDPEPDATHFRHKFLAKSSSVSMATA